MIDAGHGILPQHGVVENDRPDGESQADGRKGIHCLVQPTDHDAHGSPPDLDAARVREDHLVQPPGQDAERGQPQTQNDEVDDDVDPGGNAKDAVPEDGQDLVEESDARDDEDLFFSIFPLTC